MADRNTRLQRFRRVVDYYKRSLLDPCRLGFYGEM